MKDFFEWAFFTSDSIWGYSFSLMVIVVIAVFVGATIVVNTSLFLVVLLVVCCYVIYRAVKDYRNGVR